MAGQLVSIKDRTGEQLARALVPGGWVSGGDRFDDPTQKYRPVIAAARASLPDGSVTMFMQTGEEFLEVVNPAGLDEKHEENKIDPYFGIMMRRYLLKEDYMDNMAIALAGGAGPALETETDIPLIGGRSAVEFSALIGERVSEKARDMTGTELPANSCGNGADQTADSRKAETDQFTDSRDEANWQFILKHTLTAHPIRQYRFTKDGKEKVMILAADLFAYDYDLAGRGSGALSGLPGGLLGRGTGSYISWGSEMIGAVIADSNKAVWARQAFFRFAASFKWTMT